jgi:hypothetical protein
MRVLPLSHFTVSEIITMAPRLASYIDGKRIDLHNFVVIIDMFGGVKISLTGTIEICDIRKPVNQERQDA